MLSEPDYDYRRKSTTKDWRVVVFLAMLCLPVIQPNKGDCYEQVHHRLESNRADFALGLGRLCDHL
jgi:hypothetical protein